MQKDEANNKKQIIAKKMGGSPIGKPGSWSKKVESRNKENELDHAMFTKGDKKKEAAGAKSKHGKEPGKSWEI